jgi:GNAT superfamily N-acetyltransferase
MVAYRFCRSEDIALLTHAAATCYDVHGHPSDAADERGFRAAMHEIDLWPSSCMVALEGDAPIAVCLSAKRTTASLIHRVGVRPDRQRQGHGSHLLQSLSSKLAVLGPPRMETELPAGGDAARRFFEANGYRPEASLFDLTLPAPPPIDRPDIVATVGWEDLQESELIDQAGHRCWDRSPATLHKRRAHLAALAIPMGDRFGAYLLYREGKDGDERRIVEVGCAAGAGAGELIHLLLRAYGAEAGSVLELPKVSTAAAIYPILEAVGFRKAREHVVYATQAAAG